MTSSCLWIMRICLPEVTRKAFDALLSTFIENYIECERFTGTLQDFTVPEGLGRSIELLVECGYLECTDDGGQGRVTVRWTSKIAPTMIERKIWAQDGTHYLERQKRELAERVDKVIQLAPRRRRGRLRRIRRAMVD